MGSEAAVNPAIRAAAVRPAVRDELIDAMLRWSEEFVEQSQPVFGNLPVCPFAKAARLRRTIRFEVMPFDGMDPLEDAGAVLTLVREFSRQPEFETLFVIHPERDRLSARALETFVSRLNARMLADASTCHFQVFEAHPDSQFCVGGVYTRRGPYPSFQVLSRALLKTSSDSLLGSQYYDQFTPEMLKMVGMPRERYTQGGT